MKRGDVVLVRLPDTHPEGREQVGQRPAIAVLSNDAPSTLPMTVVVPLSSQLAALRFTYTVRIDPSKVNGLTVPSVALVFQMRSIDRRRVLEVIGHLEDVTLTQLDAEIKRMLMP